MTDCEKALNVFTAAGKSVQQIFGFERSAGLLKNEAAQYLRLNSAVQDAIGLQHRALRAMNLKHDVFFRSAGGELARLGLLAGNSASRYFDNVLNPMSAKINEQLLRLQQATELPGNSVNETMRRLGAISERTAASLKGTIGPPEDKHRVLDATAEVTQVARAEASSPPDSDSAKVLSQTLAPRGRLMRTPVALLPRMSTALELLGYLFPNRTRSRVYVPCKEELLEDWYHARRRYPANRRAARLWLRLCFTLRVLLLLWLTVQSIPRAAGSNLLRRLIPERFRNLWPQ